MSSVACLWTHVNEEEEDNTASWLEDTHIPDIVARLGTAALHAEQAEDQMFKEVEGINGQWMTVVDLPEGSSSTDETVLETTVVPAPDKMPKHARIEARSYAEYAIWHGQEWTGDARDIVMLIVVLWQPIAAMHDQFVEWFRSDFAPGMLESPELLRTRIFKLNGAMILNGQSRQMKNTGDMYQYLTIWEFDCEELPWEVLVYLGSSERWRYYVEGGHLNWQIAQYLVNRTFPETVDDEYLSTKRASVVVTEDSDVKDSQTP